MKVKIKLNFRTFLIHNFWLKIISFIIAVITWLYVNGEIMRGIRI